MNGRRFQRTAQRELPLAPTEPVGMFATAQEFQHRRSEDQVRAAEARAFGAEARLKIAEGERDRALHQLINLRKALYEIWNTSRPIA